MEVIEDFDFSANIPTAGNRGIHSKIIVKDSAVSLGKFDGIHLGHRILLKKIGQKEGLIPTVFTFSMGSTVPRLYTQQEKNQILEGMGIAREVIFPFNDVTRRMLPEQFIEEILMKCMDARYICVGEDFRFGRNREGTVDTLVRYQSSCGYELEIVEKLRDGGDIIGSTLIRYELEQGNLARVNRLLGAPYFICGRVLHGNALGRQMGFPTANLIPPQGKKLPPNGVYATTVECNGGIWYGVTNIGRKPTIGKYDIGVETYIMDFKQEIYGQELFVRFHQFLRPEQRFGSVEQLHRQMERDREAAYEYLSLKNSK